MISTYPDALLQGVGMINANWSAPGGNWGSEGTLGIALYLSSVKGSVLSCMATNNSAPRYGGGSGTPGYPAGTIHAAASDAVISNCTVMYNSSVSAYAEGFMAAGISVAGQNVTLANCTVAMNQMTGADLATWGFGLGGGLYLDGVGTVRNCLVFGNSAYSATHPANPIHGQGTYVGGGAWTIENCTIVTNWNRGTPPSEGLYVAAGAVTVRNSILWNNGDDVSGTATLAYCDIEDGDSNGVAGCISVNPLFVNAAAANCRIFSASPCVNTGTNLPWTLTGTDLDGGPRIRSRRVDMGAYEAIVPPIGSVFVVR
jgi:hypothetical protein